MRFALIALTVLAVLALPVPAKSQDLSDPLTAASSRFYDSCIAANGAGAALECACVTGHFASRLQLDEFQLLSVLNRHIGADGSISNMDAALAALGAERDRLGMSQQRFQQIMQRFQSMDADGALGDRVCMVMRTKT